MLYDVKEKGVTPPSFRSAKTPKECERYSKDCQTERFAARFDRHALIKSE